MIRTKLALAALASCLVFLLSAQPAEAQALKIGVFDAERISEETAEGARIKARINSLQESKRAEIEGKQAEIQSAQQEFLATSASLSEEKRKEMGLKIQRMQNELEVMLRSANQEVQAEVEIAQQGWQRRMIEIVRDYGQKNNYTVILPVEVVPFHSQAIDITDELVAIVDAQTSAGGN